MAKRIKVSNEKPKAGPSGSTDKPLERESKFDEEGGDQPQAPSQHDVDDELDKVLSQKDQSQSPNKPLDNRGHKKGSIPRA